YNNVEFDVFEEGHIVAELIGYPIKGFREEIKAVTYHDFEITETDQGFEASIIFDI
ncbi:archease, partial [Candidatus Saccharibacteria bacterium]|nr:archease [Candidatus Saccharibacteria bacterium]NIV04558.1 archease [Calditrichia bacterium]NIS39099.1 archease [Candidatus Saccharibacteria bacterium]NIV73159.1 archease [Calditrichia bacterium]NIW00511.1 archease [Candidatus Saccharibacteria bacterium]